MNKTSKTYPPSKHGLLDKAGHRPVPLSNNGSTTKLPIIYILGGLFIAALVLIILLFIRRWLVCKHKTPPSEEVVVAAPTAEVATQTSDMDEVV
ncbi:hypothetical protein QJS04_geneDACA024044 [Acorus gramineus]|uniref:Uncharacterized protein n=1 Tax=Acorus gramineus TaxID=55184 RepID=A0AAV8ZWF7_ACOGR|nr:hypothetical protein QJS04_geneDACA024044 [Acorus gramineus]